MTLTLQWCIHAMELQHATLSHLRPFYARRVSCTCMPCLSPSPFTLGMPGESPSIPTILSHCVSWPTVTDALFNVRVRGTQVLKKQNSDHQTEIWFTGPDRRCRRWGFHVSLLTGWALLHLSYCLKLSGYMRISYELLILLVCEEHSPIFLKLQVHWLHSIRERGFPYVSCRALICFTIIHLITEM